MHAREYVVSTFALIVLIFFCSPIFALGFGIWRGVEPGAFMLKMFVGLTNADVMNSLHSLLLPLVGAVIIFRADLFAGLAGTLVLLVLCAAIFVGFFVFMATNPAIFGNEPSFRPYITEYRDVHNAIFNMIGMLILLFLTKLGLNTQPPTREDGPVEPAAPEQAGGM